jgi:hypothetical protein
MTLTREAVIATAKELVAAVGPYYIYEGATDNGDGPGCSYAGAPDEGVPACLVGQIVQRLDPAAYDALVVFEGVSAPLGVTDFNPRHNPALTQPWALAKTPIIDTGDDAELTRALRNAQGLQDAGNPWSRAIEPLLNLEG